MIKAKSENRKGEFQVLRSWLAYGNIVSLNYGYKSKSDFSKIVSYFTWNYLPVGKR